MSAPILFLDVDGVVNSEEWMRAGNMWGDDPQTHFAPHLCARLDRALAATGCEIVVSSSWRVTHTHRAIESFLRTAGARHAHTIGETPTWRTMESGNIVGAYERRGAEIQAWLDKYDPRGARTFAIIDDSDDMGPLRHRLVRTTWDRGIEDRDVERLIAMLGRRA